MDAFDRQGAVQGQAGEGIALSRSALSSIFLKRVVLAAIVGVGAGLTGAALALCLHWVQHISYGYSLNTLVSPESFLEGVGQSSPLRRIGILIGCGVVAGFGWYGVTTYLKPLISVANAVKSPWNPMPLLATMVHALLQIVTVAMGSPLGREVAPRELAAFLAQRIALAARISEDDARVLIASGAGAGLAAVYNVPVAGTLFVMEVLLKTFRLSSFASAAIASTIAALVARCFLGGAQQYDVPDYGVDHAILLWSVCMGPIFGIAGFAFQLWATQLRKVASRGPQMIMYSIVSFAIVGVLSVGLPQLLGNGKAPTELSLTDDIGPLFALVLLVTKIAIIGLVLRSGAKGGLLTPALTLGALMAVVIGGIWSLFLPAAPLGAFAIIGAAAFLSSSMAMPITATFLAYEFMQPGFGFVVPIAVSIFGATVARMSLTRLIKR